MFHSAIREALAVHEAYRRLNFSPDEIFLRLQGVQLFVMVRRGDLEFNALVSEHFPATEDMLQAHWDQACHAWNVTMSEVERRDLYNNSMILKMSGPFVAALVAKGFSIARADA